MSGSFTERPEVEPKTDQAVATAQEASTPRALWRTITRLDKGKINAASLALRNSCAVALPLGIGIALGNPLGAVAITTGALNVSYSDGRDPYAQRARRMLTWSALGAFAVFVGSVTGQYHWASILVVATWAFVGGMFVAVGTRAGDLGLNTLVAVIVFAARGAMSPRGALYAALLVLGGGLLQTAFALLGWPLRRYEPERRAVGGVYAELAKQIGSQEDILKSGPLKAPSSQVQDTLDALGRDHSLESERFRNLLDQADRIRLSVFTIVRLRNALANDTHRATDSGTVALLDSLIELASKLISCTSSSLVQGVGSDEQSRLLKDLAALQTKFDSTLPDSDGRLEQEVVYAVDVVSGQLRAVSVLSHNATSEGLEKWNQRESAKPGRLQLMAWFETLRANLDIKSAVFRHAIRLSVCVAVGDAIGRGINWQRSYWLPMTIAVVLKPDFTTTISRGILRLSGTFTGLLLATILSLSLPQSALTQLILVGAFTFALRRYGPANYGIFSASVAGLIVFLISVTGVPAGEVVVERALNTAAGGLFALFAYMLWPTWERTTGLDAMAQMLDATREYFHAVVQRFSQDDPSLELTLEESRRAWRQARTAAESSVDRLGSEPRIPVDRLNVLTSMLASSHTLVYSIMALEAELTQTPVKTTPDVLKVFANDVELTLYYLSASLRGSAAATSTLPHLREDHTRMMKARDQFADTDEFLLFETDRITTGLNTLREQVSRLMALG